jgi:hypothetical protein
VGFEAAKKLLTSDEYQLQAKAGDMRFVSENGI